MASLCIYNYFNSPAYESEEDDCYSDEEYGHYFAPDQRHCFTYKEKEEAVDDFSSVISECDPCLLLQIVLDAKAVNGFLRLSKFWHGWFNAESHWKEYWTHHWPGGYIPTEHKEKPYSLLCKSKWAYLTWVGGGTGLRISKDIARFVEAQGRIAFSHSHGIRKGDMVVSRTSVCRYKNGHYSVMEGQRESHFSPFGKPSYRLHLGQTSLAKVITVNEERGTIVYQAQSRHEEVVIPWNHLGDKLMKLWKEVKADRNAGKSSPRILLLENPKYSDIAPFSGCRLVRSF